MSMFNSNFSRGNRGRRKGLGIVYVVAVMPVLFLMAAFTVDLGQLYYQRAEAQKAADAAALAAAFQLANFGTTADADTAAKTILAYPDNHKYEVSSNIVTGSPPSSKPVAPFAVPTGSTVSLIYPFVDAAHVTHWNQYEVKLTRQFPAFFGGFAGLHQYNLGVHAVAEYSKLAPMSINGLGTYGTAPGPVNLSDFGPNGYYNNGDCYSVTKLADGAPNPLYTGQGYNFNVSVPSNIHSTTFEIFDPDCWNANSQVNAGGGNPPLYIDEFRTSNGAASASENATDATTNKYTFYSDNGTPGDLSDDVQLWNGSYGYDSTTDMKWNTMYTFNRDDFPAGTNFRVNVTSTAGSSENGFDLRIGPTRSGSTVWDPNNGTVITADGHLPINFNQGGTVDVTLGTVPVGVAGGQVQIRKFDTDVGAVNNLNYTCSTLAQTWNGVLSGQGTFQTDTLDIPTSYTTAGTFVAHYSAGLQDTSVWDMTYSGFVPGTPGGIKLVE